MSDFLNWITAGDDPVEHKVKIGGKTGSVWFRRISAGERQQLLEGEKYSYIPGSKGAIDLDLGQNERKRQQLVLYSVCHADGSPAFKNIDEVRKIPAHKFAPLAEVAEEVNRDAGEERGKS